MDNISTFREILIEGIIRLKDSVTYNEDHTKIETSD
jgi:hypothetical protein